MLFFPCPEAYLWSVFGRFQELLFLLWDMDSRWRRWVTCRHWRTLPVITVCCAVCVHRSVLSVFSITPTACLPARCLSVSLSACLSMSVCAVSGRWSSICENVSEYTANSKRSKRHTMSSELTLTLTIVQRVLTFRLTRRQRLCSLVSLF